MYSSHTETAVLPVMRVKTRMGIQTTAREVSRGWEAALHTSPLLVTVLSEAGPRSEVRASSEAGAVRLSSCNNMI